MHPPLYFTREKENNVVLPFLNILIHRSITGFLTPAYRNPAFAGLYFRCYQFDYNLCPSGLIHTHKNYIRLRNLRFWAKMVILCILWNSALEKKCNNIVNLGWLVPRHFQSICFYREYVSEYEIYQANFIWCKNLLFSANLRAVFVARPILRPTWKDILPTHLSSSVIYKFRSQYHAV